MSSSSSSPKSNSEEKHKSTNRETSESSSSSTEKAANASQQARQKHEQPQEQPAAGQDEEIVSAAATTTTPSTMEALSATIATAAPAPAYGLQSYWEERYSALLRSTYSSSKRAKTSVRKQVENDANSPNLSTTAGKKRRADNLSIDTTVTSTDAPRRKVPKLDTPQEGAEEADAEVEDVDEEDDDDDDDHPLAGHEWYFSYQELRPLLLPLILGRDLGPSHFIPDDYNDDDDDENNDGEAMELGNDDDTSHNEAGDGEGGEETTSDRKSNPQKTEEETSESKQLGERPVKKNEGDDDERQEEAEEGGDDKQEDNAQLPVKGPQKILEVGCGEVPLGQGIWKDMLEMQRTTGANAKLVVSEIHCVDYSTVMIDILRQKQQEHLQQQLLQQGVRNAEVPPLSVPHGPQSRSAHGSSSPSKGIPTETSTAVQPSLSSTSSSSFSQDEQLEVTYSVMDARRMSFPNETFHVVMDKGTLDAMLSDKAHGSANCIAIVSEMARVLRVDGYLVIISHLNANTPQGLEWLHEVVIGGIHQSSLGSNAPGIGDDADDDKEIKWEIEVHGRDQPLVALEDEAVHADEKEEPSKEKSKAEEEKEKERKESTTEQESADKEEEKAKGKKEEPDATKSGDQDNEESHDDDEEEEEPRCDWPHGVLGPAVYIVHKFLGPSKGKEKAATPAAAAATATDPDTTTATTMEELPPPPPPSPPSIPLKFFVY